MRELSVPRGSGLQPSQSAYDPHLQLPGVQTSLHGQAKPPSRSVSGESPAASRSGSKTSTAHFDVHARDFSKSVPLQAFRGTDNEHPRLESHKLAYGNFRPQLPAQVEETGVSSTSLSSSPTSPPWPSWSQLQTPERIEKSPGPAAKFVSHMHGWHCFNQVYEAYMSNLKKGFTIRNYTMYHPALKALIISNEPDLKVHPRTNVCRAMVTSLDAILQAEKDLNVTEILGESRPGRGRGPMALRNPIALTVTYSFAAFGRQAPGLGQMEELYHCMKHPEKKNDVFAAYKKRWVNSFNTAAPGHVVEELFLDKYAKSIFWSEIRLPVFIGEYHSVHVGAKDDLPILVNDALSSKYPFYLGYNFFEFSVRYDKGGSEKEFGMFGYGDCPLVEMNYSGKVYTIWNLVPAKDKYGYPLSKALKNAYGKGSAGPVLRNAPQVSLTTGETEAGVIDNRQVGREVGSWEGGRDIDSELNPCAFGRRCKRQGCFYDHPEGRLIDDDPTKGMCKFGIHCVVEEADCVLVSVLPKQAEMVLRDLAFRPDQEVISLVAGLSVQKLRDLCAPAHSVSIAIPFPSVAKQSGAALLLQPGPGARAVFRLVGRHVAVEDPEHFRRLMCISGLMGNFYKQQLTAQEQCHCVTVLGSDFFPTEPTPRNLCPALYARSTDVAIQTDIKRLKVWQLMEEDGNNNALRHVLEAVHHRLQHGAFDASLAPKVQRALGVQEQVPASFMALFTAWLSVWRRWRRRRSCAVNDLRAKTCGTRRLPVLASRRASSRWLGAESVLLLWAGWPHRHGVSEESGKPHLRPAGCHAWPGVAERGDQSHHGGTLVLMRLRRRCVSPAAVAAVAVVLLLRLKDYAFATTKGAAPLRDFRVGQQLRGVVSYVADKVAMVDVGAEKEGLIPFSMMGVAAGPGSADSCFDCVREGEEVDVWVSEISHPEDLRRSKLVLSRERLPKQAGKVANVTQFQSKLGKVWFNGTVSRQQPYGIFVQIEAPAGDGFIEGLVHRTECTSNETVGSEVQVRAVRLDPEKNHLYLSMRPASEKGVEARLAAFKGLARQVLPGTVVRQSGRFGAFVEVSHPDGSNIVGLVPSQEKAIPPRSLEDLHVGQELTGVVIRVQPVVLIDVGLKIRGVLPAGKISAHNDADEERVSVGDRVQVWVSEVRHKSNKRDRPTLILAMDKNKIYSLWNSGPVANLEDFQNLNDQEWYTGTLTHKLQAGWFVSVPSPLANGEKLSRHGLVYLPECKGDAEIGSSVKVRVLGVDLEKGHLHLSMRTSPPLRGTEAKLALYRDLTDHWLEGRVKSFGTGGAYGASVEVRHPAAGTLVGILPKAQMDPTKQLVVDGKIQVRIWDVADERLFLSMQEKVKEMPKEFLALVEDELGSASAVEMLEEGQKVEVRVTDAGKDGLELALCT
eukprot:s253_g2.t2